MDVLKNKKLLLMAIREAVANMKLEDDFIDIFENDEVIKNIEEKVKKIGDKYETMGRLYS